MITRILNSKTKTITSAAFLLAISALLSRILGFTRDRLLMIRFGAGEVSDMYYAAFRIPDFVYNLLIVGAIAVAFLPVFSEYFNKRKADSGDELESKENELEKWPEQALHFTNNLLNCFLVLLVCFCVILAIFTPFIIKFIVPGFSQVNKAITINLTRIMFLSPILFGISAIFSGILQYFDRFLIYSIAPLLYNLGIIFGILFLVPAFGIYGLGYGVILGAFLYFLIQLPAVILVGFKYKLVMDFGQLGIRKVFKMMGPRIIGVTADNINLLVTTAIASTLAAGSISIFNLSNNFQYLPIGIIGISFAVSSFPVFSKFMASGQKKEFFEHFSSTFCQIIFLIVPISFLFFLLRAQIIRLLYGAGNFGWVDTRLTAAALGIFCFSILANSLIPLVARAFFSFKNTKTPVIIGVMSVVLNIFFSIFFIFLMRNNHAFYNFWVELLHLQNLKNIDVIALPLAFSLVSVMEIILMLFVLYKKIGDFGIKKIGGSFLKTLLASVFLIIPTYFIIYAVSLFVNTKTFLGIFWQTFFAGALGVAFYMLGAYLLKIKELKTIFYFVAKHLKK